MEVHKVYLDSQYKGCVRKEEYVGFVHQKKRCMTASSDCIRLGPPLLPDVQCRTFPKSTGRLVYCCTVDALGIETSN